MKEKKPLLYSIRAKLIVGFVIVSLVSMAVATTYAIRSFDKYIGQEFSNKLQANLNTALLIYKLKEKTLTGLAQSVSEDNVVKVTLKIGPRNQLANYIAQIVMREKELDLLTIVDKEGIVVARATDFFSFGDDLSEDPLIKKASEGLKDEIIIGAEIVSQEELKKENLSKKAEVKLNDGSILQSGLMLKVLTPIYLENEIIGVAILGNLLNNDSLIVERIEKEIGIDVHILQKDIIISSTCKDSRGISLLGEKMDLEDEKIPEDLTKEINLKGEDYLIAPYLLKNIDGEWVGTIVVSTGIREMIAMKETTRNSLLLIALASISLVIVLAIYLSRTLADPIHRTIEAMTVVGKGDFSKTIKEKRKDEIGKLIESFNKMTADLRKSRTALEESKAALEIRVAARTKELKELAVSLEEKVQERTKEFQDRVNELEKFHRLTIGRELKMMELKRRIKEMEAQLREVNLQLEEYAKKPKRKKTK